jgi:hypothetical protein
MSYPERNVPFKIYEFRDVEKNGILHNGVFIVYESDGRDIFNDRYFKAKVIGPNIIQVTVPSMGYSLLYESSIYEAYMKQWDMHCERISQAMEIARNNIIADEDRKVQTFILRFPEHFEFSNIIFNEMGGGRDGEIDGDFAIVPSVYKINGEQVHTSSAIMFWKIALAERMARIVKRKDGTANAMTEKMKKRGMISIKEEGMSF